MARTLKVALSLGVALLLFSVQGDTREPEGTQLIFASDVEAPSSISYCKNSLYAYSPPSRNLTELDPKTGARISEVTLGFVVPGLPVQSITCWKDALLVADRVFIHRLDGTKIISPTPELKGLYCGTDSCIALGEEIKKSSDLKTWTTLPLQESKNVEPVVDHSKENPFWNWHEQFQLSKSRYSKSAQSVDGRLFILDALRSAVVFLSPDPKLPPKRWGRFGHFEGDLTYPRGITVLKSGDVAISDTGLKLVFVFSPEGEYKGFIGSDGKDGRFGYPLDVVVHENILYIADFSEHKVRAIDLSKAQWPRNPKPVTVDELLVADPFQHPAVQKTLEQTRCLSCHDGTEINSLDRFGKMHFHHPVGVELKPEMLARKIDLPLGPGNTVNCNSCHDGHHETHPGQLVSRDGKVTHFQELPFHLRKSERELCAGCHFEHSDPAHNHIDLIMKHRRPGAQVISCEQCHQVHGSHEKMLVNGIPGTCLSCHNGQHERIHEHAEKFPANDCLACHALHQSHGTFLKNWGDSGAATCVSCHKDFHGFLDTNPHMEARGGAAACLSCHQPHQTKSIGPELCISCHSDHNQLHRALIATSDTDRAQGINLKQEHVTCVTCHEPHGKMGQPKFLRPKEPIVQFCSSCHGEKAPGLFENYHERIHR